jgi:adenosylhomocysteine nucleosidase
VAVINHPPIAIIVAMESERTHLDAFFPGVKPSDDGIWPTWQMELNGTPVVVIVCGIGMVSAAAATEHAITRWRPAAVLNFGCTGAHSRELFPGDVVIGTDLVHQGRMRFAPDGEIIPLEVPFTVPGEVEPRTGLSCDPDLIAHARSAAGDVTLPHWPDAHRLVSQPADRAPVIRKGPIASADVWLQDPARLDAMHQRTGTLCEDMEAAAIGQIATLHGVPFLSIKDISNSEFHVASVFEGTSSVLPVEEVGKRAAILLVATLDRMTSQPA